MFYDIKSFGFILLALIYIQNNHILFIINEF